MDFRAFTNMFIKSRIMDPEIFSLKHPYDQPLHAHNKRFEHCLEKC